MEIVKWQPYYQGIALDLKNREHWVGIIGSRKATNEECRMAYSFARKCAEKGKIVVSGLAMGIDEYAHKGAIDANGLTIAIVGTTIDKPIYPPKNMSLAEKIMHKGGLLHPFLEENTERNNRQQFRNRLRERNILLAYLCQTIVVVKGDDAPIEGGTRWATKYGMDFGKNVYRLDLNGKFHQNPPVTDKETINIWWEQELDVEEFVRTYLNG